MPSKMQMRLHSATMSLIEMPDDTLGKMSSSKHGMNHGMPAFAK